MAGFVFRRLVLIAVTLLVLSALVFLAIQLLPGDLAHTILGAEATPAEYAALRSRLDLDRPLVLRYITWLLNFVRGQWGHSYVLDTDVRSLVTERLVNSLKLGCVALVILVPSAIATGVVAAIYEGKFIDRCISFLASILMVIPEFVSGIILILLLSLRLRLLPSSALAPAGAGFWAVVKHLLLPALPVVFVSFGYIEKMARAGVMDSLDQPYVRTALFKGLSRWQVVWRHVLRNALPPTLSVSWLQASFVLSGLVIVEQLFTYPGLGKLLLDASTSHDVDTLQASVFVMGLLVMASTLLADLTLVILDPRVRHAR